MLEVISAKYISGFTLRLLFSDGAEGAVNLEDSLWGPAFEPLKKEKAFKTFFISPTLHTLAWPNDVDFAPEYLREKIV